MPDGYGGSGEGSGNQYGGGNGGNGGGNHDSDNESAAESNRLAAANQAAANQAAADAASRASDARAQMDNSSMSALSSGFQTTPENQRALSEQQTVRDFLARVEADKQTALGKPPESEQGAFFYNPNVGTNVTNALDAAKASGVNTVPGLLCCTTHAICESTLWGEAARGMGYRHKILFDRNIACFSDK